MPARPIATEIRLQILQEHAALRAQIARLDRELDKLDESDADIGRVGVLARELLLDLAAHTHLEDRFLAPLLREREASGPVRAQMLLQHHAQQREHMHKLMAAYRNNRDLSQVVRMTTQLLVEVQADMLHEEATLLREDLFREHTQTSHAG